MIYVADANEEYNFDFDCGWPSPYHVVSIFLEKMSLEARNVRAGTFSPRLRIPAFYESIDVEHSKVDFRFDRISTDDLGDE